MGGNNVSEGRKVSRHVSGEGNKTGSNVGVKSANRERLRNQVSHPEGEEENEAEGEEEGYSQESHGWGLMWRMWNLHSQSSVLRALLDRSSWVEWITPFSTSSISSYLKIIGEDCPKLQPV